MADNSRPNGALSIPTKFYLPIAGSMDSPQIIYSQRKRNEKWNSSSLGMRTFTDSKSCHCAERTLASGKQVDNGDKKNTGRGYPEQNDEDLVKEDNKRLQEVRAAFDEIAQKNLEIDARWISGLWALEVSQRSSDAEWERDQMACENRFDCCARNCGCYIQTRRSCDGQVQELFPDMKTHYTDNYGCCMRWRNNYQSEKEDQSCHG